MDFDTKSKRWTGGWMMTWMNMEYSIHPQKHNFGEHIEGRRAGPKRLQGPRQRAAE